MKVIYGVGKINKNLNNPVLAIGVFDGLHLGHQELIRRTIRRAKSLKGKVLVMTFSPHPLHVLRPEINLPYIVSLPYRLKLLEDLGVDICIVINFTMKFSKLSPKSFIERYLVKPIAPKEIFVGDDFRFGQDREGTLDLFQEAGKKFGFKVNAINPIKGTKKEKISSTTIRQYIAEGDFKKASALLGRPVSIMGKVQEGDSRGKLLGFPTANLYPQGEVIPPKGAYAVNVVIRGRHYQGMANIGIRPTFLLKTINNGESRNSGVNIEVHIFNFNKNLYEKEIIVEFIEKIRNEKMFPSQEQLIAQLKKDEIATKSILVNSI